MHRFGRVLVALVAFSFAVAPAIAQQSGTGGISGRVFFETTAQGGGGQVWVQAFRLPDLDEAKGVCVDGFEYEILGLRPGTYKLRFGFGCGVDRDQPPHEWFVQTSGPDCAAEIVVAAGFVTDGINADVNRDRGPEFSCGGGGEESPPEFGQQRPIGQSTPSPTPTGEVEFTPGVVADPAPGTPWGTVVGFAVALVLAVAGFLLWTAMRGRRQGGPPSAAPAEREHI